MQHLRSLSLSLWIPATAEPFPVTEREMSPTKQLTSPPLHEASSDSEDTSSSLIHESSPPSYRESDTDIYETIGSSLYERDAGPVVHPPVYDPTWVDPLDPRPQVGGALETSSQTQMLRGQSFES